jgi:hypothetical protein
MVDINKVFATWHNGALKFKDYLGQDVIVIGPTTGLPFGQYYQQTVKVTTAATMAPSTHGGAIVYCSVDGTVLTLPTAAATTAGVEYTFVNTASDGGAAIAIKTGAAADYIFGYSNYVSTSIAAVNTKTTQRYGDTLRISQTPSSGWAIGTMIGTWSITTGT